MFPLLRDGDVVTVTPAARTEVRVGDVICYEALPGRLIVHRVIARVRERLLAKGDALSVADSVDLPQLLGKVTAIERRGTMKRLDSRGARVCNRLMAVLSRRTSLVPLALRAARRMRAAARG